MGRMMKKGICLVYNSSLSLYRLALFFLLIFSFSKFSHGPTELLNLGLFYIVYIKYTRLVFCTKVYIGLKLLVLCLLQVLTYHHRVWLKELTIFSFL